MYRIYTGLGRYIKEGWNTLESYIEKPTLDETMNTVKALFETHNYSTMQMIGKTTPDHLVIEYIPDSPAE